MFRARLAKASIENLSQKRYLAEERKKYFVDYLRRLKNSYLSGKISPSTYGEIFNKKIDGRTIVEWIKYYERCIKDCDSSIEKKGKRILPIIFLSLFFILIILGTFFYIQPQIVGFFTQEQKQEFTQIINLDFKESSDYNWIPEHTGQLASIKVSGSVNDEENSIVKIYLDDLLIFDNSKIKNSNGITGQTIKENKGNGIFSFFKKILGYLPIIGRAVEETPGPQTEQTETTQTSSSEEQQEAQQPSSEQAPEPLAPETIQPEEEIITEPSNETIPQETSQNGEENSSNESSSENQQEAQQPSSEQAPDPLAPETIQPEEEIITEPSNETIPQEFIDICEETCNLENLNLNKNSYNLRIEIIGNSTLNLKKIKYEIFIENITNVTIQNETIANATITTTQSQAVLGKPVKWAKHIIPEDLGNLTITLPQEAENITIKKLKEKTEQDITSTTPITGLAISERGGVLTRFFKNLFSRLTGRAVEPLPPEEIEIEVEIDDTTAEYQVEYETPAPYAEEEITARGKKVHIVGPETIHYENVLAFSEIPESFNLKNEAGIKIYWVENNSFLPIQKIDDLDLNGIYDYVEWLAPHLSNQTFEIILITKAEHLDSNKTFISDIYEQVKDLDGNWSEIIPDQHYIQVTFEQNLTNEKDITIYPRIISGNPRIEVYEFNGTELIAEFSNLTSNEYNKVYLTNISENYSQNVFDLKIVDGEIELDHIIDPTLVISTAALHDISMTILDSTTGKYVAAYCDDADDKMYYKIAYTNGTILSTSSGISAGDSCRVGVAALSDTAFVIAYVNWSSTDSDAIAMGLTTDGAQIFNNVIDSDGDANTDIDVCALNSTHYAVVGIDDQSNAAGISVWNLGTLVGSHGTDSNVAPDSGCLDQDCVSCSALSSNSFSFTYFDDSPDGVGFSMYDGTGTQTKTPTAFYASTNTGATSIATLRNGGFVIAGCDDPGTSPDSSYIRISIYNSTGSSISSPSITLAELGNGACSGASGTHVDVSALNTSDSKFVVVYDRSDTNQVYFAVYNYSGSQILAPTLVESTNTADKTVNVIAYDPITNYTLCQSETQPVFAIAYNNLTDSVIKTYYSNGSAWNGSCVVPSTEITFNITNKTGEVIQNISQEERPDEKKNLSVEEGENRIIINGINTTGRTVINGNLDFLNITDILGNNITTSTQIFALENVTIENATIRLEKTEDVDAIAKCEDWNFTSWACNGVWQITDTEFTQTDTYIEFNVTSFSGWVGTSYTYDDFEHPVTNDDYCTEVPSGGETQWAGSICDSGAGSFNLTTSEKFLDTKSGNVTRTAAGTGIEQVNVYDGGVALPRVYSRVYFKLDCTNPPAISKSFWYMIGFSNVTAAGELMAGLNSAGTLGCYYTAGGGGQCGSNQTVSCGEWHSLEIAYRSFPIAQRGIKCYLDSNQFCVLGSSSFASNVTYVALGSLPNSDNSTTGTIFFDEYRSSNKYLGVYPNITNLNETSDPISPSVNQQLNATVNDSDSISDETTSNLWNVWINVSINEGAETKYDVATNTSSEFYFTLNEGNYSAGDNITYNWWANDSNGQLMNLSGNFSVDGTGPALSSEEVNDTAINTGEYFCVNITATDTANVSKVYAEIWDTTAWVNYTMVDDGPLGPGEGGGTCDPVANDHMYGASIQGSTAGTWNYSQVYANDSLGNWNNYNFADKTVTVSAANNAPQITYVSPIANTDPSESSLRNITFYVTMSDTDGVNDLNDSSVNASFSKVGETNRTNSSCVLVSDIDSTSANYSCIISMWYWDGNGNWNVTAYGKDNNDASAQNTSTYFQYNLLTSIVISPSQINFAASIGTENQTATNDPTLINNTGNTEITSGNLKVTGINLQGETSPSFFINVSNVSIGTSTGGSPPAECSGTALQNGTEIGITGATLPRGNLSLGGGTAQEEIYYCLLKVIGIPSQAYSTQTSGSWTVKIVAALGAITLARRKKKKKVQDDKLVEALNLIADELKEEYSLNKKEIISLIIEKLSSRYKVSKKEIKELIEKEQEIPLSIFKKELGALESLVKYMKENLNMNCREIALALNRNERTIWTAYKKATQKQKNPIQTKETGLSVGISIFKNRNLTILEAIIVYLKEKGMKYSEIAKLLDRDQRNIWTIYSKANKKSSFTNFKKE